MRTSRGCTARNVDDILFADELATLQARMANLNIRVWLNAPAPGWFGLRGRISRGTLWAMTPDFGRRTVYCCGPAGFMQGIRQIHAAEGARRAAFHIKHFGPSPSEAEDSEALPLADEID